MNAVTDKELLELAAKAAGIELTWNMVAAHLDDYERTAVSGPFVNGVGWNPLSDDGDALRIAVKLGIGVLPKTQGIRSGALVCADTFGWHGFTDDEKLPDDLSTRRAIVRAAAQLGKDMK